MSARHTRYITSLRVTIAEQNHLIGLLVVQKVSLVFWIVVELKALYEHISLDLVNFFNVLLHIIGYIVAERQRPVFIWSMGDSPDTTPSSQLHGLKRLSDSHRQSYFTNW